MPTTLRAGVTLSSFFKDVDVIHLQPPEHPRSGGLNTAGVVGYREFLGVGKAAEY
ncbi:MAG: hypothetical protein GXY61_05745 [Lentisphaerae bacterium]|nr:hypothetical protein [Lentisphaerota bacterium]